MKAVDCKTNMLTAFFLKSKFLTSLLNRLSVSKVILLSLFRSAGGSDRLLSF